MPVGLAEIAQRLDVERAEVARWKLEGRLPTPRWVVDGRPASRWLDIAEWANAFDPNS